MAERTNLGGTLGQLVGHHDVAGLGASSKATF
jgi:hypothetical protein